MTEDSRIGLVFSELLQPTLIIHYVIGAPKNIDITFLRELTTCV